MSWSGTIPTLYLHGTRLLTKHTAHGLGEGCMHTMQKREGQCQRRDQWEVHTQWTQAVSSVSLTSASTLPSTTEHWALSTVERNCPQVAHRWELKMAACKYPELKCAAQKNMRKFTFYCGHCLVKALQDFIPWNQRFQSKLWKQLGG